MQPRLKNSVFGVKNMKMNRMTISIVPFLILGLSVYAQSGKSSQEDMTRKKLELDAFNSIGLGISAQVWINQGEQQEVWVEGPAEYIESLSRAVENKSWNIKYEGRSNLRKKQLSIFITIPEVKKLSLGGSGKISTKEPFQNQGELSFAIGGSGIIDFSGTAESLKVSIGGSGSVQAKNLKVKKGTVSIGGSGECYVHVSEYLEVSLAGSGSVLYKGNPKIKSSIAGSGKVEYLD